MEKDPHLTDNDGEQPGDNFYHGVISKIFWNNQTGVVRSDRGKDIPFVFAFVTLLGAPRQDINFLRPGMRVGFDVGWTSKGLRVSTIKIYDLYQDDLGPNLEGASFEPSTAGQNEHEEDHPISRYRIRETYNGPESVRPRQRRFPPRVPARGSPPSSPRGDERQKAQPPSPSPSMKSAPPRAENEREKSRRPRPPRRFKGPRNRSEDK
ncbi:MAG: hypothetical protein AB7P18_20790 [Candidatus Binatia bacterium]